jgi:hypothetical protein
VFKVDLLPKGLGIFLRIANFTRKRQYSQNLRKVSGALAPLKVAQKR